MSCIFLTFPESSFADRFNGNGPFIIFLIFWVKSCSGRYNNILWYIFLDTQDIFLYTVSNFVPKYQRFETTKKRKV